MGASKKAHQAARLCERILIVLPDSEVVVEIRDSIKRNNDITKEQLEQLFKITNLIRYANKQDVRKPRI